MDTISFLGTTIFDSGTTGVGWQFKRGPVVTEVIESQAPLGDGYWVKPRGKRAARLNLTLQWMTASPATVASAVTALASGLVGSLTLPIWGTLGRCRLEDVGDFETVPMDGGLYALSTTLTFVQYP